MEIGQAVVLTGVIVAVGRWADDKPIDSKLLVGAAGTAVALSVLSQMNEKLGSQFALLILVAAALVYGIPVASKLSAKYQSSPKAASKPNTFGGGGKF